MKAIKNSSTLHRLCITMNDRNTNSPHLLNTSANLAGLCFIVLTFRNILSMKEATVIDEITAFAIIAFMVSCTFSFFSLPTPAKKE
jgi:hypothetical protein